MPAWRGLTWDHPRGYRALDAAAARARSQGLDLCWERQPLEGFESAPIEGLAAHYDLVVIDHPHLGEAVSAGCLRPLDTVFPAAFLDGLAQDAIGPAFSSYVYDGRAWALPLDAASQVTAFRADLLDAPPPETWAEVETMARHAPMALSLAGPHAILTLFSIAVACGEPPTSRDPDVLLSPEGGWTALSILRALYALRTPAADALNPIGVLEAMARGDDVAFCPLIYGYVTYAQPDVGRRALGFADAPADTAGGRPGSTLGGTGIAVSTRRAPSPELAAHLAWLMDPATQAGFIPAEAGQPGLRDAWTDPAMNAAWSGFYRATARTLEAAWVRPRHRGYIAFQTEASAILRAGLADGAAETALMGRLQDRYAASRAGAGEI